MLYYLRILLRHLCYCSIQRLHIRLSCVRWSTTNRASLIRFCSICPVLVWLHPGKETERRTYVLPGSRTLMRPVYKDCSELEFLLAFTKSLYYPCDSLHIIKFLSRLYSRTPLSYLHWFGAEQQHLTVLEIYYICTHLCNCKYMHILSTY